jgi:hypothetical protein
LSFVSFFLLYFVGCATSAPDWSSPRGYSLEFALGYRPIFCWSTNLLYFIVSLYFFISLGAQPALPMGVAPEATSKYLYFILGSTSAIWPTLYFYNYLLSEKISILLIRVAPGHMNRCVHLVIGSRSFTILLYQLEFSIVMMLVLTKATTASGSLFQWVPFYCPLSMLRKRDAQVLLYFWHVLSNFLFP